MRWKKNEGRNRRIYERKMKYGDPNWKLGALFGMSKSNIGYVLREYKKDAD